MTQVVSVCPLGTAQVLAADINLGCEDIVNTQIERFNGQKVARRPSRQPAAVLHAVASALQSAAPFANRTAAPCPHGPRSRRTTCARWFGWSGSAPSPTCALTWITTRVRPSALSRSRCAALRCVAIAARSAPPVPTDACRARAPCPPRAVVILESAAAREATGAILETHGIPADRSPDLLADTGADGGASGGGVVGKKRKGRGGGGGGKQGAAAGGAQGKAGKGGGEGATTAAAGGGDDGDEEEGEPPAAAAAEAAGTPPAGRRGGHRRGGR